MNIKIILTIQAWLFPADFSSVTSILKGTAQLPDTLAPEDATTSSSLCRQPRTCAIHSFTLTSTPK